MDPNNDYVFPIFDLPVELQLRVLEFIVPREIMVTPTEMTDHSHHPGWKTTYHLSSIVDWQSMLTILSMLHINKWIRHQWRKILHKSQISLKVDLVCSPPDIYEPLDPKNVQVLGEITPILKMFGGISHLELVNRHFVAAWTTPKLSTESQPVIQHYQIQSSTVLSFNKSNCPEIAVQASIIAKSKSQSQANDQLGFFEEMIIKSHMQYRLWESAKEIFNANCNLANPEDVWKLSYPFNSQNPEPAPFYSPLRVEPGLTLHSQLVCGNLQQQGIPNLQAEFGVPEKQRLSGFTDMWMTWDSGNDSMWYTGVPECEQHPIPLRNIRSLVNMYKVDVRELRRQLELSCFSFTSESGRSAVSIKPFDPKSAFMSGGYEGFVASREMSEGGQDGIENAENERSLRKEYMERKFGDSNDHTDGLEWLN